MSREKFTQSDIRKIMSSDNKPHVSRVELEDIVNKHVNNYFTELVEVGKLESGDISPIETIYVDKAKELLRDVGVTFIMGNGGKA